MKTTFQRSSSRRDDYYYGPDSINFIAGMNDLHCKMEDHVAGSTLERLQKDKEVEVEMGVEKMEDELETLTVEMAELTTDRGATADGRREEVDRRMKEIEAELVKNPSPTVKHPCGRPVVAGMVYEVGAHKWSVPSTKMCCSRACLEQYLKMITYSRWNKEGKRLGCACCKSVVLFSIGGAREEGYYYCRVKRRSIYTPCKNGRAAGATKYKEVDLYMFVCSVRCARTVMDEWGNPEDMVVYDGEDNLIDTGPKVVERARARRDRQPSAVSPPSNGTKSPLPLPPPEMREGEKATERTTKGKAAATAETAEPTTLCGACKRGSSIVRRCGQCGWMICNACFDGHTRTAHDGFSTRRGRRR